MSSTAEPVKHPSEGDAPDPKKVKTEEKEAIRSDKTSAENNTKTTDDSTNDAGGTSKDIKSSNGNDKQRSHDDEEDDEQDGEELTGEELDSDLEQFDPKITRRLQTVESIQQQISKLNELASEEILKVEQKFNKLRRPHFEQRNNILKDVTNFWATCLANHPSITHLIESPEDEECLHYLVNLDVEEAEDIKSGYNLKFHFKENPYIKNDLIVREIRHINSDEVVSKSTPVEYKDTPQGRSLKNIVENSVGQFTRGVDQFSFFAWICLPCETGSDEIAELIKDQIWPSPLEFFFQTADEYDDDDDDDDSDDENFDEDFENEVGQGLNKGEFPEEEIPEEDIEGEELDDDDDDDDDDDPEDGGEDDEEEEDDHGE